MVDVVQNIIKFTSNCVTRIHDILVFDNLVDLKLFFQLVNIIYFQIYFLLESIDFAKILWLGIIEILPCRVICFVGKILLLPHGPISLSTIILKLCDGALKSILGLSSLMKDRCLRIWIAVLLRVSSSMIILNLISVGSARSNSILICEGSLVVEACGTVLLNILLALIVYEHWHRFAGRVCIWICHHSFLIRILLQILVLRVLWHLTTVELSKWIMMHRWLSSLGRLRLLADVTGLLHLIFLLFKFIKKIWIFN